MNVVACVKSILRSTADNPDDFSNQLEELINITTSQPQSLNVFLQPNSDQQQSLQQTHQPQMFMECLVNIINTIQTSFHSQPSLATKPLKLINLLMDRADTKELLKSPTFDLQNTLIRLFKDTLSLSSSTSTDSSSDTPPQHQENYSLCIRILRYLTYNHNRCRNKLHNTNINYNINHLIDLTHFIITIIMNHNNNAINNNNDNNAINNGFNNFNMAGKHIKDGTGKEDVNSNDGISSSPPLSEPIRNCLALLSNLTRSHQPIREHLMSRTNIRAILKKLLSYMSSESIKMKLSAVSILTNLCLEHSIGAQIFNSHNIIIVFQLIFNLFSTSNNNIPTFNKSTNSTTSNNKLHNINNHNNTIQTYACELFIDLLNYQVIRQSLTNYKYLDQCLQTLIDNLSQHHASLLELMICLCTIPSIKQKLVHLSLQHMSKVGQEEEEEELDLFSSNHKCPLLQIIALAINAADKNNNNRNNNNNIYNNNNTVVLCLEYVTCIMTDMTSDVKPELLVKAVDMILSSSSSSSDVIYTCITLLNRVIDDKWMNVDGVRERVNVVILMDVLKYHLTYSSANHNNTIKQRYTSLSNRQNINNNNINSSNFNNVNNNNNNNRVDECCIDMMYFLYRLQPNNQRLIEIIHEHCGVIRAGITSPHASSTTLLLITSLIHQHHIPPHHFSNVFVNSNHNNNNNNTRFHIENNNNINNNNTNTGGFTLKEDMKDEQVDELVVKLNNKLDQKQVLASEVVFLLQSKVASMRKTEKALMACKQSAIDQSEALICQLKIRLVQSENESGRLCHMLHTSESEKEKVIENTRLVRNEVNSALDKLLSANKTIVKLKEEMIILQGDLRDCKVVLEEKEEDMKGLREELKKTKECLSEKEGEVERLDVSVEKLQRELEKGGEREKKLQNLLNSSQLTCKQREETIKEKDEEIEKLTKDLNKHNHLRSILLQNLNSGFQ